MARRRIVILALASFLAGMISIMVLFKGAGVLDLWDQSQTGVHLLDAAKASSDFVLIAPLHTTEPKLITHDGHVVHVWHLSAPVSTAVSMLPDGSLVYVADAPSGEGGQGPIGVDGNRGIVRVSWDGTQLWALDDPNVHHDFTVLPDGTVATLRTYPMDPSFSATIHGGIAGSEFNGQMWGDQIVEANVSDASVRVIFDDAVDLAPRDYPLPDFMSRSEWTHMNSLAYLPHDPITGQEAYLVNSRSLSTMFIVARATGKVIWQYGGPWVLNQEHDASILPNGRILVFDNGQYVRGFPSGSMALEIDPRTNTVVWSFPEHRDAFTAYYSSIMGGAQRLDNGNTMITYAVPGRVIEVTPDHQVAWDYRLATGFDFKVRSYPAAEVESLLH